MFTNCNAGLTVTSGKSDKRKKPRPFWYVFVPCLKLVIQWMSSAAVCLTGYYVIALNSCRRFEFVLHFDMSGSVMVLLESLVICATYIL